ncbi:MAG: esterase-like activity of phytase family protein, partial [Planctomycetaceae bacterium]
MSRRAGIVAPCRHGLALVVATAGLACTADDDSTPDCVATFVIEAVAGPPGMPALGGISDLCVALTGGGAFRLWAVTDRGPNGQVPTSAGTRRSLLAPDFSPCLLELDAGPVREACRAAPAAPARLAIETFLPLRTRSGRPASGRPTGAGRDPPLVDHASREPLAPDPDGIDSEAVAVLADGSFWLAEEYGPALVHVAADGRMLARLVPAGSAAAGADAIVEPVLPAAYAGRRDHRGFEALAVLAGEGRLAVLLQSPLAPDDDSGRRAGNVPLLVIDAATRRPVAEHLYRAGDPRQPRHATHGNAPDDVKLCAMTPAGPGTLLVLEQGDDGSVWLAEEYGPALVHVAADGRMLARLVPAGGVVAGADASVEPVLPAAYAGRRD